MAKTANITQKRDIFTGKSDFFTCLSLTFKAKHFLTENVVIAITLLSKQRCYPGDDICNVKHPMYGEDLCLNKVFAHWFTFRWYQQ
ncbi:Uncharacterised protein [Klebsiella michiganensis]|uniref:Uncharacterized protein n=1 Tax=Klebsiella michiganensis TaxID=1134687 RepID=A0A7H4PM48_9ENTR|nr:Uncharacterised protein [Klebsiella michiganensis]